MRSLLQRVTNIRLRPRPERNIGVAQGLADRRSWQRGGQQAESTRAIAAELCGMFTVLHRARFLPHACRKFP